MKILIQEDLDPAFPANLKPYISNKLQATAALVACGPSLWAASSGAEVPNMVERMWGNILTGLVSFSRKNLVCLSPPPKINAEESHEY